MGEKPTYIAYTVREYTVDRQIKGDWMKVGVAFPHSDGKGLDIRMEAMPVNGRITLRLNEPKAAPEGQSETPPPLVNG